MRSGRTPSSRAKWGSERSEGVRTVPEEGSEVSGLMLLDPGEMTLFRGPTGVLRLTTGAASYLNVVCYRAFPLSHPEEWVVFVDGAGKEIGMLRDPEALEASSAALCNEELDLRYVVPRVVEVVSVREDYIENRWNPALVWELMTERGPLRLHLPNLADHVRPLGPGRLLFTDRDGRRCLLQDAGNLPPRSRALLSRYLWLDALSVTT